MGYPYSYTSLCMGDMSNVDKRKEVLGNSESYMFNLPVVGGGGSLLLWAVARWMQVCTFENDPGARMIISLCAIVILHG